MAPGPQAQNQFSSSPQSLSFAPLPSAPQALPAQPLVIEGAATVNLAPAATEISERQYQEPMFASGAALRDCYKFMVNPNAPGIAPPAGSKQHLGAALLGRATPPSTIINSFAFVDRSSLPAEPLPDGWKLLDDATLLSAVDHIGKSEPLPLAATQAFESFLARKALSWGDAEVAALSVEFLTAFGRELTPRLDVHHRIRSRLLSQEELATLTSPAFSQALDHSLLHRYQPALTHPSTTSSSSSSAPSSAPYTPSMLTYQLLNTHAPATPREQPPAPAQAQPQPQPRPETPGTPGLPALLLTLPASPRAQPAAAKSAHALLFTKA